MNYDLSLVAAILESGNIGPAVRAGVTSDMLTDEGAACWELIQEHFDRFQEVPSLTHFRTFYPGYEHHPAEDSIEALVDEIKTRNLGNEIDTLLEHVAEANGADPWEALTRLSDNVDKVMVKNKRGTNDHILGSDGKQILSVLKRLKKGGGLIGFPWPWPTFNEKTFGVVPGQVFYFYGREKSRKTFLLLWLALYYWSIGLKVLFVLRDTPLEEMKWRSYAMAGGLHYGDFVKGRTTDDEDQLISEIAEEIVTSGRFIYVDQENGFAGFRAKIEEYNPDVVFHDYPKGIADDEMESAGANVSQEARYVARMIERSKTYAGKKGVPMFFAGHANRKGVQGKGRNSEEMAWSDHIARRVDGAFRVIQDDRNNRMALFVTAGRSMPQKFGISLDSTLCDGFGEEKDTDTSWVYEYEKLQEEEDKARSRATQKPETEATKFDPKRFRKRFRR